MKNVRSLHTSTDIKIESLFLHTTLNQPFDWQRAEYRLLIQQTSRGDALVQNFTILRDVWRDLAFDRGSVGSARFSSPLFYDIFCWFMPWAWQDCVGDGAIVGNVYAGGAEVVAGGSSALVELGVVVVDEVSSGLVGSGVDVESSGVVVGTVVGVGGGFGVVLFRQSTFSGQSHTWIQRNEFSISDRNQFHRNLRAILDWTTFHCCIWISPIDHPRTYKMMNSHPVPDTRRQTISRFLCRSADTAASRKPRKIHCTKWPQQWKATLWKQSFYRTD